MPGMLWLETQFVASTCLRIRISEGRKKKIGVTASGKKAKPGRTIAADTSLYPFGTKMNIPGYGWGVVGDRGGAIKGGKIDLFFRTHKQALKWGRKTLQVEVVR